MSEVPLEPQPAGAEKPLWPVAAIILLVVFAPAAVAWLFSLLHA